MHIVVHSITPVNDRGALRAFVDVTIDGDRSSRWRLVKEPNKRAWVQAPQTTWSDPSTGEILGYRPLINITKSQREEVQAAVLAMWQEEGANE